MDRRPDSFTYDQANRLKTASVAGTSSSYVYDGDGKRASKTVGVAQTGYVYDVNASLPVLLDDGSRKYVWGLGLAFAVNTGGNAIVYHADGLGSMRALSDGSGNVVQTYQYDEYGVVVSSQGSMIQPFQYTGEQSDETGFTYLRARAYDPGSARFLQRDTGEGLGRAPQTLNRFAYAQGNPVLMTDPSGMMGILPPKNSVLSDPVIIAASVQGPIGALPAAAVVAYRLVVGGGAKFGTLKPGDIALNIDWKAIPNVVGNIAAAPFRNGVFSEVFFENIPGGAITGPNISALDEAARVLQQGGNLVIQTGIWADKDAILARLQAIGFQNIVSDTSQGLLRITAALGGGR